jgi:cysteine desulfurase
VAATEHEAILQTAEALRADGADVSVLGVDADGRVDPEDVRRHLRDDTALVSLMAANNETGALLALSEVGNACRDRGVPFHTDAVQLFGKVPFRFDDLPVDLASISSHKIGGPKGVGALLIRQGIELRPLLTGGGQEGRVRPGTENLPGIVGFATAARQAAQSLPEEARRLRRLRDALEAGIREALSEATVNADRADRLPNTSSVSFAGADGAALMIALDLEGVAVSTGAACHAGASGPSHVLLAMGRSEEAASGTLRFSLGSGTTEAEIEEVLALLPEIVRRNVGAGIRS